GLFSVEEVANSLDLQTLITAGTITLTYVGEPIANLTDLCITPGDLTSVDWYWLANRPGNITVAGIDLLNGSSGLTSTPFVAGQACQITRMTATHTAGTSWNAEISTSSNNGGAWTIVNTSLIDSPTKQIVFNTPLSLATGTWLRVRFLRVGTNVSNPSVNLFVRG
ncbi:MAG: hypothetical protein ACRCU6_09125, partial [Fusobacteriaceae bacterium]